MEGKVYFELDNLAIILLVYFLSWINSFMLSFVLLLKYSIISNSDFIDVLNTSSNKISSEGFKRPSISSLNASTEESSFHYIIERREKKKPSKSERRLLAERYFSKILF